MHEGSAADEFISRFLHGYTRLEQLLDGLVAHQDDRILDEQTRGEICYCIELMKTKAEKSLQAIRGKNANENTEAPEVNQVGQ